MTVIVISRQFGSLGDDIAKEAADLLGLQLMSQDKVHQMAQDCDANFKKACEVYEREVPKGLFERFFFNHPAHASLFESLTYELAGKGDVVIMGRGAQLVLSGLPGVFKARIVAPFDLRVKRIAAETKMDLDEARHYVDRFGRQRRALIEAMFHKDLSDWSLYDMTLNTEDLSVDEAAQIIAHAVKLKKNMPMPAEMKQHLLRMALAKKVESAIREKLPRATYGDVEVTSEADGEVILGGPLNSRDDVEEAGRIAKDLPGVNKVTNQLRVTAYYGI